MKILVVEDEPEAREGLVALLKKTSPDWDIMPACKDGESGMKAALEGHPDIVITDIRMPNQDGLAMIEAFKKQLSDAEIIVLSAHPDFEYARRCIALGVREYLVKPATANKIIETVRLAEDERFTGREFLWQLTGKSTAQTGPSGTLVLYRYSEPIDSRKRNLLKRETRSLFGPGHAIRSAELDDACYFFVESVLDTQHPNTGGYLAQLSHRLRTELFSCARRCDYRDVARTAALLKQDLRKFLLAPKREFFVAESAANPDYLRFQYNLGYEADFAQYYRTGDHEGIKRTIRAFFTAGFREGFDPIAAVQAAQRFFSALQTHIRDIDPAAFRTMISYGPSQVIENALSWENVRDIFERCCEILTTQTRSRDEEAGTENAKVRSAIAIIDDRIYNPPSLTELAEELHLSFEYLSRLFKQEVGVGFARYVTKRRIALAQTLLSDRSLSVAAIAAKLGFQDSKYFFELFRKETGLTPNEYRGRFM